MRILMISGDPNTLISGKEAYERMGWYRGVLGDLKILVPRGTPFLRLGRVYFEGASLCRQNAFDIITAQAPDELGLVAYFLSCRFSIPLQLQIHTDVFSPWYRRTSWKERIRYWLARLLIPRADCIRVVSERIRKSLLESGIMNQESRIIVLPIFTDVSKFLNATPGPATEARLRDYDFKMIAVGRFMDKEKNFSMLVELIRDFIKICPRALLVLVGEGPDRKKYEARIKNQGFEKHVTLEKWRDDLSSFYKSFDLYLLPSNYEGWGRTVIEAMAAGLPVVMTDVGLAGEVVKNGENGTVVPAADKKLFLRAITDLYRNPERRKEFSRKGQERISSLLPKTKEEYLRRYRDSFSGC